MQILKARYNNNNKHMNQTSMDEADLDVARNDDLTAKTDACVRGKGGGRSTLVLTRNVSQRCCIVDRHVREFRC
jgi:hypothetical protein